MESTPKYKFKIVLMGNAKVGKTTFLQRHTSGEFNRKYIPTVGVDMDELEFQTNYGTLHFIICDVSGQDKFSGIIEGYYLGIDAAILMFSLTDRDSYKSLPRWNRDIDRVSTDKMIPKVVCGNKVDEEDRKVKIRHITWPQRKNFPYFDISAKSTHNFEKPFLYLARQLTGHPDLRFEEPPLSEEESEPTVHDSAEEVTNQHQDFESSDEEAVEVEVEKGDEESEYSVEEEEEEEENGDEQGTEESDEEEEEEENGDEQGSWWCLTM